VHHHTADTPQTTGKVIRKARCYDLFSRKVAFGRDKLVKLAAPVPGETVLDVGCGTGTLTIAIHAGVAPGEVHGIDASPEMIAVAVRKAAEAALDIDFRVAVVEELPFPDDRFDLVTSSLMLHHLPDDLKRRALAEIRRVLRPGGRFVAMDMASESHSRLGHLLSVFGHTRGDDIAGKVGPMMRDAGFEHVETTAPTDPRFAFLRGS
jgi:demethylmenaquinone methyltransferase/2-methoxy-6-polyprenyl-1,4-benzoquinol methylase/phosphoethanolamine N-methyltransferase